MRPGTVRLVLPKPEDVAYVPPRDLPAVALELASLQAAVAARWLALGMSDGALPDRLLTVREIAPTLGMSEDWIYRHADSLPFTRRQGRRALRFSETALRRYLADQGLDSVGSVI